MKFTSKLRKHGGSIVTIIPSPIAKKLNLKEGMIVELTIESVEHELVKVKPKIVTLKCKACTHQFDSDDYEEDRYCPACQGVDLDEIKEESA